jgi:hypothetical protein
MVSVQGCLRVRTQRSSNMQLTLFRGTSLRPIPRESKHKDVRYVEIHAARQLAKWTLQTRQCGGDLPRQRPSLITPLDVSTTH